METEPTTPLHLGQKLQQEAVRRGLKPPAVAALFGVRTPSVYDWYKDGRIDRKHFQALVDWSGRPIEWWLDMRPASGEAKAPSGGLSLDFLLGRIQDPIAKATAATRAAQIILSTLDVESQAIAAQAASVTPETPSARRPAKKSAH